MSVSFKHTPKIYIFLFYKGCDPPNHSETRTVYVANRFPQHGHYVPQKFADNRIISSKVGTRLISNNML